MKEALKALRIEGPDQAGEYHPPIYDPSSNGATENACKLVKGQTKAILLGLEREIQARIPLDHPIMPWLVTHAAYLRALLVKGDDGKTAHQRARGTAGPQRLLAFGEVCRCKCRAQEPGIGGTRWRFSVGVWLGIEKRTGQFILYDKAMGGSGMPAR